MKALLVLALAALATPAFAAVDRDTAVTTLSTMFFSATFCNLPISRAKIDDYRTTNTPAGDTRFNVDVFTATKTLDDQSKSWSKDQGDAFCAKATDTARQLGMLL